jgi:deaminated glutathione amidase
MDQAAAAAVDFVIFPEGFMNHYPPGTPAQKMDAEPLDGPFARGLQSLAREHG